MNDLVKYNNDLNKTRMIGFTGIDYNIFMYICSKMRDKGESEIEFSFAEIKSMIEYKNRKRTNQDFRFQITQMSKKLAGIFTEFKLPDGQIYVGSLFRFVLDSQKDILIVRTDKEVLYLLNAITSYFTAFELKEFVGLKGKYTKCMYRFLKQFKSTGRYNISLDSFKTLMDISGKSYQNKEIMYSIINPSIEELRKLDCFSDLKCEVQYDEHRRGKPIRGYVFTFEPEKSQGSTVSSEPRKRGRPKKNKFLNFEQSDIDYDAIAQKKVLERLAGMG